MIRVMTALGCLLSVAGAAAASPLRFKTRTLDPIQLGGAPDAGAGMARHLVLQFHRRPTARDKAELARRGIRILREVPDDAVLASVDAAANLDGLDLRWAGPLAAADKLSPALEAIGDAAYLVIFHPDVDPGTARRLVEAAGLASFDHPALLPGHLAAAGPAAAVRALALSDEVAYVLPAPLDLLTGAPVASCPGPIADDLPVGEYVKVGRGWATDGGEAALRYVVGFAGRKLPESTVRSEVARALDEWAKYARVRFTPASDPTAERTIAIRFASGPHGDAYPFDGPGKVLAHTFYPAPPNPEPQAGDMHLDDDEDWRVGAGVDLFSVVLHEAGHALGLAHSDRPGSVMYPYYRATGGLSSDDIAGIRELYGAREETATPPPVTPPQPPVASNPGPTTPPAAPAPGGPADGTPPGLKIQSPAFTIVSTSAAFITFRGTASDNVAVTRVRWSTSTGASGDALGISAWTAEIPLLVGTNAVTIRAYDAAGNSSWRAVTVVRR